MASTTAPTTQTIPPYPATAVAAVMQEELLRAVRSRFRRKGQPLPIADDDVVLRAVEIDSLKVTESVVKAGGYGSIEAAVKHVVSRIETRWNKYHKGEKS
jgi:hypothetical protein